MKTAIYIEDGIVQLVVTPENEFEKDALKAFESNNESQVLNAKVFTGSFYDCRGGWIRQQAYYGNSDGYGTREDRSLIIRTGKKP